MAAFTTPFWIVVAGITVVAAGVAHLTQPDPAAEHGTSAPAMAQIERQTASLADVAVPDEAPAAGTPAAATVPLRPFALDPFGRLAVTDSTLGVLDHWLASVGRAQLALLEPRLRAELPPLAAERAWSLLQSLASYREAERELLQRLRTAQPAPTSRERLDQTMALRRRHFDSISAQELFGMQEARALYAADVAAVLADKTLTEAQQVQRLLALRTNLPPMVAAQEFGGSAFSFALERQVAEMRAAGESDAEVVHLRRQYVDTEGAKSVIELEREEHELQRKNWELQHPEFVRQREALFAADMDVTTKQQQLDALLQQHVRASELANARRYAGI